MIKIYHNNRCRKSREALNFLIDNNIKHTVIEYLKNPISKQTLINLLDKLNYKPENILRKNEKIWKENFKDKNDLSKENLIDILIEYPKLIERPIVEDDKYAVIARPIDNLKEFFNK
jgi:arsenate reductase